MPNLRNSGKSQWVLSLILLWMLFLTGVGTAETVDQIINPRTAGGGWVSDMADVVDDQTENRLNEVIDRLEQETTAEIAVVTIRRTDGRTPKAFATDLFNLWGIGKSGEDNGVLVLMVVEERRIEVETGYGVEGVLPDGRVGEILDTRVVPRFRQGDVGAGLLAGVQAMADEISDGGTSLPSVDWRTWVPYGMELRHVAFILVLAALIPFGVWVMWRRGIRYCPQCRSRMRRLTEVQDDAYISSAQNLEEDLGSVNYIVWRCDDCQICEVKRVLQWGSFEDCPKCRHRTVYVKSFTLKEPSYTQTGRERIVRKCRFPTCTYESTKDKAIPTLIESSADYDSGGWFGGGSSGGGGSWGGSSGGGGFGGGSSGGGGAGRGW